jgi:hypothetical protein
MPRDGLQQYAPPPGTQGVANYTIESARYNTFVADITTDQNNPRPIVAGGTGASTALQAMINLSGEIAKQIITNYSSAPWVNGSFYSAAGATGAPNPTNRFAGIYYGNADDSYATVEARDQTTGILYVQQKVAGVWSGTWLQGPGSLTDTDARYVNVTGDTMSGPLIVPVKGNQIGTLGGTGATGAVTTADANFLFYGGAANWAGMGVDGAGNVWLRTGLSGTPVPALAILNDQTAYISKPTAVNPANNAQGTYYFGNSGTKSLSYDGTNYTLSGGGFYAIGLIYSGVSITSAASATAGSYYFGQSGTKYLNYDGTNFNLVGGALVVSGVVSGTAITSAVTSTTGILYFGTSGTKYLNYDGTAFNFVGGTVIYDGNIQINKASALLTLNALSGVPQLTFAIANAGQSFINDNGSSVNVYSNAAGTAGMYIIHGGNAWSTISDARLPYKKTARPLSVLDKIDKVQLYENEVNGHLELFVKAQEFNEVFPHLVVPGSGPDDMVIDEKDIAGGGVVWGVSYDRAGVAALQGLKELKEMVVALRAEIAELKAKR